MCKKMYKNLNLIFYITNNFDNNKNIMKNKLNNTI